jgi:hypothetical protein
MIWTSKNGKEKMLNLFLTLSDTKFKKGKCIRKKPDASTNV